MPKKRKELKIETLERMVQTGQKKFVSYSEGKMGFICEYEN